MKRILLIFTFLLLFILNGFFGTEILYNENNTSDQKTGQGHDEYRSAVPEYKEFSELSGKTVSMLTGAPF